MIHLIGLSGYARSGKDTIADILQGEYGFEKTAFAMPLKRIAYHLMSPGWPEFFEEVDDDDIRAWDALQKQNNPVYWRHLLQRLGTDVGRDILGHDIWLRATLPDGDYSKRRLVVTDVRFPNEADRIKELSGQIWRIHRPGVMPAHAHVSDTSLDDYDKFDAHIDNNSSIEDLTRIVRNLIGTEDS